MKKKAIIVDLDSTMFDDRHRLHLIDKMDTDPYYFYHNALVNDKLNKPIRDFCNTQFCSYGTQILIVTARPEYLRAKTVHQLNKYNCTYHDLRMRKKSDLRTSVTLKYEALEELLPIYNITLALEDRNDVIAMYQQFGIPVLKIFMGEEK